MTVQQLIDELNTIEDKSIEVKINDISLGTNLAEIDVVDIRHGYCIIY